MSTYCDYLTALWMTWSLLGSGSLIEAQRPTSRNPRTLSPQERQFLELDVELGAAAPVPARRPAAGAAPVASPPIPREVARQKPEPSDPGAVSAATPFEVGPIQWHLDFESTKRRPIETAIFGKGPKRIAVLSSLTGNSESTVALVEKMAGVFARDGLMPVQLSVLIVRTPNPDGLADRTLTNSRGVDLNRNFPSTRFTASPTRETGEKPGSEPETRAIVQLLNQFRPEMVIHVVESRSTRGTVRSDDFVPRDLLPAFDSAPFDKVYKTGSLSGYVHETLQRSIVEIELPAESTAATDEDALLQVMVTTLDQSVRSLRTQLAATCNVAQQVPSSTREAGQVRPDGLRGNVEFLPAPPDAVSRPTKPRFFELPPPPE